MTSPKIAVAVAALFWLAAGNGCDAQSAASPIPPACQASSNVPALAAIGECTVVYCASNTEVPARTNLKLIDDKLIELQITTAQTRDALEHFKRACRAIGANLTLVGPATDDFRQATFQLGLNKSKLSDQYNAIQTDPLESTFANTSSAMASTFRRPACMQQINSQTIDSLNAAQDILSQSTIDCSPELIRQWFGRTR